MQFEGITLFAIISEISEHLCGGYIQKIHQPTEDLLILQTYKGAKYRLLIATGKDARIHITQQKYGNPANPSPFCMLLRKYLMGAVLDKIEQPGLERIVNLVFKHREGSCTLKCELMGNRSNVILLEGSKILGAIHARIGARGFTPNSDYEPPQPQEKLNPFKLGGHKLASAFEDLTDIPISKALAQAIDGLGPRTAKEILKRASIADSRKCRTLDREEDLRLISEIERFFKLFSEDLLDPHVYWDSDMPIDATPVPYESLSELRGKNAPSFSEALDAMHEGRFQEPLELLRAKLTKQLQARVKRGEKSLKQATSDLEKAEKYDHHKMVGDLLMGNLERFEKGMKEVELIDFDGNQVRLSLDPRLTPVENAQARYKKYKKLKRGVEKIAERERNLRAELQHLEDLGVSIDQADSVEELNELEIELDLGNGHQKTTKKKSGQLVSGPRRYSIDGYIFLIGRNGRQNDALIRQAHKEDLWFHAKDRPGAHGVLSTNQAKNIPPQVLEAAAQLTAYFSRGRDENKVSVTYTRVKNLRKPKGAKPGLVLVTREEGTLTVTPTERI